jgi:hypothetical protein
MPIDLHVHDAPHYIRDMLAVGTVHQETAAECKTFEALLSIDMGGYMPGAVRSSLLRVSLDQLIALMPP